MDHSNIGILPPGRIHSEVRISGCSHVRGAAALDRPLELPMWNCYFLFLFLAHSCPRHLNHTKKDWREEKTELAADPLRGFLAEGPVPQLLAPKGCEVPVSPLGRTVSQTDSEPLETPEPILPRSPRIVAHSPNSKLSPAWIDITSLLQARGPLPSNPYISVKPSDSRAPNEG